MGNKSFDKGLYVMYSDQNKVVKNALNLMSFMFLMMGVTAMLVGSFISNVSEGMSTILFIAATVLQIVFIFAVSKNKSNEKGIYFCLLFALLEGAILPVFFLALGVTLEQIFTAMLITAVITMATGYIGYTSKNLSSMGKYLFIAIIALIVVSIAQMFIESSFLYSAVIWAGVLIFSLFIMYDVNQMRHNQDLTYTMIALNLFIDVMGLFKYILHLTSSDD